MDKLSRFFRLIIRLLIVWFVDAVSLLATAWLIPGISFQSDSSTSVLVLATVAALLLGIVNLLIRPLLLMISLPLGWMVIFLVGFFINAITLMLTSSLMPGFEVNGWGAAFLGSLVLAFANTIMTTLLAIDDDESFYENMVQRQAARQAGKIEAGEGRGLVMLETDGLSYERLKKALDDGIMPNLKKMIEEEGYQLTRVDCGVPPTTPASQAGILQGNNTNIPAFRWLDKKTGTLLAGGQAAAIVEPILSDGNGLLRGGSSIGNMFSGDAAKSILTLSKIKAGTPEDKRQRARDMYMLMRNPYFLTRTVVLYFGDALLELWQGWQQHRKNIQPRLNRLHKGYPFLRAAVNVFMRDVGTYFTILDIVRGVPAMYTLYAGYDEVAHHSGPYSPDTNRTLHQFDREVGRIKKAIEEKAPRPYEIICLSDHGQSFGATFKQRYEVSILEFIQQQMPQGTNVAGSGGGDDGTIGVSAMLDELQNMQDQKQGGRVGKTALRQTQRLIEDNLSRQVSFQEAKPAKVTVAYGGNGALVYFDLFPRKITINELNAAYPGVVDKLVQHEGIGFVVGYEDDLAPVAFGKGGARNLQSGEVVGEDPLVPFGDVELRAWQLRRMANFENAGDLILNSTLYQDGTVAALEELIGNHGGLGGEQTDAYMFHPCDMVIPETRSAYEFKAILDARRGLPGQTPKPERPAQPQVNPWRLETLEKGLGQVGKWVWNAVHAMALDRETYRQIARDPYMTGPALLIGLLAQVLQTLNAGNGWDVGQILTRSGIWLLAVLLLYFAARMLRGKTNYTTTLRVAGFAASAHILEVLGFIPVVGTLARFMALLVTFFGIWIGTATANELKGWRTALLPVVFIATVVISVVFLNAAFQGIAITYDRFLQVFGVAAP